ncbi:MAG: ABC transporter substrate-binding protein [Actinobacteria bacterium]|nr:ABC transporter substrate-binding protein [Actinomycetota bacterium]
MVFKLGLIHAKRILIIIGIISVIGILIIGISVGCLSMQTEKYTASTDKLSIGMQDNISPTLVWIAKGKGFFEEEGLDIELKKYPSGKLALMGLINNEVDLCATADIPIMSSCFERSDFLILCTIANSDNALWIIARKDKGITKPEDLRGKKIATQKNSAAHFFLCMFLLHNQIPDSEVYISYMEAVDLPNALINGEIDAFCLRNPYIQEAKDALGENAQEFFGPGIYRQTFNIIGKKDFVYKKPELIEKVIKAVIKAEELADKDKDQAIKITAEMLGAGREKEVITDWPTFTFEVSLNQSLIVTLEDEARWAIKNKLTNKTEVPNYLDYIYIDVLEKMKPEAVGIIH